MTTLSDQLRAIEEMNPKMLGWCSIAKAQAFFCSVIALRPEISVEIGVFGGRSLIPLAMAHKEIGRGIVWAIEPWDKGAAIEAQTTDADRKWWAEQDMEAVYQDFIKHVEATGTGSFIRVIRLTSDAVEPPAKIDFLHVDGAHSDQAIKDVKRFGPRVRTGGICAMDDIYWFGGGVTRAAAELKILGFRTLYTVDTTEVLQKIS
jgi:predicted O-methyltransferase YrrM